VIRLQSPTQTQLAEALDIARPSVGTLIDHLENTGYVSRVRDAGDRRVWRIIPTRLAIQRAEEFARAAERVASQAFDSVARNDLTKATALLLTISDNLKS
jgi:DNA-binding MarR family transcriptional regulator